MVTATKLSFSERRDPRDEHREIGAVLRESMARHGVGVTECALALGIPRNHLYQIQRGDRPLYAEHLPRLPEAVRDDVTNELLGRWRKVLADKLPGDSTGLRDAAQALVLCNAELVGLVRKLAGKRVVSAGEAADAAEAIGTQIQQIGASLIAWARTLKRERVVGMEEDE